MSDDNAYTETLFKTAKYRPECPTSSFANLAAAPEWSGETRTWTPVDTVLPNPERQPVVAVASIREDIQPWAV